MAPDRRGRDDQRGRGVRGLGQHGEGHRQPDGGRLAHPGQLATADDADDGESSGGALRRRHGTRVPVRRYDAHSRRAYPEAVAPAHPSLLDRARGAVDVLVREMLKFGVVGAVAFVVDIGVFNMLRFGFAEGTPAGQPLRAKVISVTLGHADRVAGQPLLDLPATAGSGRRTTSSCSFIGFNLAGMAIALACLAVSHYVLDLRSAAGRQHQRQRRRAGARHAVPVLGLPPVRLRRRGVRARRVTAHPRTRSPARWGLTAQSRSGSRLGLGQEQREDHRLGLHELQAAAVGLGEVAGEGEAQARTAAGHRALEDVRGDGRRPPRRPGR